MSLARGLDTLLLAAAVAALAPMLVALLPGPRIPQVVVLVAGGVLIGPEVLAWAERAEIDRAGWPSPPGWSPPRWLPPWSGPWPRPGSCTRSSPSPSG
jgi:hypothetical protein